MPDASTRERILPGSETDACPLCGIHRKYAGYTPVSCGDHRLLNGCFVDPQAALSGEAMPTDQERDKSEC